MEYDPLYDPVVTTKAPNEAATAGDTGELTPTPTTWLLVAIWIVVYLAMTVVQGGIQFRMASLGPGAIATPVAHEFGALTAREVASGQVWRTVTATFLHLSLLHLICNLSCLIAFGRVLDSWYGGPQFFAIYLVIAALGNGFAVAGRYLMKGGVDTLCAGGSSVMFGLIALMAVVGWRAKTRFGDFIRRKMVGKLVVFGLIIGIIGRDILDNYGHAGGALAGAIVGLFHKQLIAWWDRRAARWTGFAVSAVVVVACVVFQAKYGLVDYRARLAQERAKQAQDLANARAQEFQALARRAVLVRLLAENVANVALRHAQMGQIVLNGRGPFKTDPTIPLRREIDLSLKRIDQLGELGTPGGDPDRYARWQQLARDAVKDQPGRDEILEFRTLSRSLQRAIADEIRTLPTVVIKPQAAAPPKAR